jgi:predicted GIY-YIG superfamily endonuclease
VSEWFMVPLSKSGLHLWWSVGSNPTLSATIYHSCNWETMSTKEWFFYMVRCNDNSLYSGITINVEERLKKHNSGTGARYTSIHRPVNLVYSEKCSNIADAMKREKLVKRWPKIKKERLARGQIKMDVKVKEYIDKQKSPQKEICLKLRDIILKTFPSAKEEMRWGVPVFANGRFYLGALKDHVNLGFSINGLTKEEMSLFEGRGKTMRHIKVMTLKDIDEKKIVKLLEIAGECSGDC